VKIEPNDDQNQYSHGYFISNEQIGNRAVAENTEPTTKTGNNNQGLLRRSN